MLPDRLRFVPVALAALLALLGLLGLLAVPAAAQLAPAPGPDEVTLDWYLPDGVTYDPAVPTPASVLGHEVGRLHVRPDQWVAYALRLADASDRVVVETTGRTHGLRPQLLLTISSPDNLARRAAIRDAHRALSEPPFDGPEPDLSSMPVVVAMGYSIHGNEPSGTNAALLAAYHLAAAEDEEVEALLDEAIVLIDPMLNPDGIGRFAHWTNTWRGAVPVADPATVEHREAWPRGRTNHYWFDLNRDWLLLQHPESRNRVAWFQDWRPNVFTDHHEMGGDSTYFFQPGVPSRKNPLTPERNVELTQAFARFHGEALDRIGSLYYTEETFDDFYYGKGSTYPDVQGAVGILFEQASSRGHVQETANGLLTFPFTIRNQLVTSLSTLAAARDQREELLAWQREFYRRALADARADGAPAGWVVGDAGDPARLAALADILNRHGVEARHLSRSLELDGVAYEPGAALVVPAVQRQALLARALFEERTSFEDETFYDVSAWTLPHAFGLPFAVLDGTPPTGEAFPVPAGAPDRIAVSTTVPDPAEHLALAFDWTPAFAPRALQRLLAADVRVRVAERPFTADTPDGPRSFGRGTVVVVSGAQPQRHDAIRRVLETAAAEDGVEVVALSSGLTPEGIDLGSPSLEPLEPVRPALLVGDRVSSYASGELWHLLDHRYRVPVVHLEIDDLAGVDLSGYTHLLVPDGFYRGVDEAVGETVRGWVRDGGSLVAIDGGAAWAERAILGLTEEDIDAAFAAVSDRSALASPANPVEEPPRRIEPGDEGPDRVQRGTSDERRSYGDYPVDAARRLVSGTIFEAELDLTHPLCWGYTRDRLALFRTGTGRLVPSDDPYAAPVRYTPDPLLAGYVSRDNLESLRGVQAVVADRLGRGVVVRMADAPTFRGVWWGSSRLVVNSVFLSPLIRNTSLPPGVRGE